MVSSGIMLQTGSANTNRLEININTYVQTTSFIFVH